MQIIFVPTPTQASSEINRLRSTLIGPFPSKVVICSASSATRDLIHNILKGFDVTLLPNLDPVHSHLERYRWDDRLDFLILDDQFQTQIVDVIQILRWSNTPALRNTKIVHLYTPTAQSLSETVAIGGNPNVAKIIKPPRKARILQVLGELKGLAPVPPSPVVATDPPHRMLVGNILVAEGAVIPNHMLSHCSLCSR